VGKLRDYLEEKEHTSKGGTCMWGMRDCRLVVAVGNLGLRDSTNDHTLY
jgi:hypothetical protein